MAVLKGRQPAAMASGQFQRQLHSCTCLQVHCLGSFHANPRRQRPRIDRVSRHAQRPIAHERRGNNAAVKVAKCAAALACVLAWFAASAAPATPSPASAAAPDPRAPVTIVVPFSAGGPTDRIARDLAPGLARALGREVIIENAGGAGGTLGATKVARAAPDGQTLLLHHIGMATAPTLYRRLPYKPLDDFAFLGMISEVPMTLIGRPSLPPRDFKALLAWLRANESKAQLADAGLGAASQLCGLLLQQRLGLKLRTVSFKGTGPAMSELLGGQVDILCDQTTNTTEPIAEGRVRAYAVTTRAALASPPLNALPTLAGLGLEGFHVTIWHGLYAPRGTPDAVVARLNAALRQALRDPDFAARQRALGAALIADERLTPDGHRRFVADETAAWAPAIRAAGQFAD